MKFKQTATVLLFATLFVLGCKKSDVAPPPVDPKPVANFSYSGAGLAPALVTFINSSSDATSYSWDFGDGATSTSYAPSHTYVRDGNYTVNLTASGSGGTNSVSKTISIQAPTSVKITSFKLIKMPMQDPNCTCAWDNDGSGADVYFDLLDASNNVLVSGGVINNVSSASFPLGWTFTPSYQINNLHDTYGIGIYDKDGLDPDDIIAGFTFTAAAFTTTSYPTIETINIDANTQVQLGLEWH